MTYSEIKALIFCPDSGHGDTTKQSLENMGFQDLKVVSADHDFRREIARGDIDLIVCDGIYKNDKMMSSVRALRNGELSTNIFPIILFLVEKPQSCLVKKLIGYGPDAMVIKPFTRETLSAKIHKFVKQRALFVVTCNYIGPDRRLSHRPKTLDIPKMYIPNPLNKEFRRSLTDTGYKKLIFKSYMNINELRIERQSFQIKYLVNHIEPGDLNTSTKTDFPPQWIHLMFSAQDLAWRAQKNQHIHLKGMPETLVSFLNEISSSGRINQKDLRLLSNLSSQISRNTLMFKDQHSQL